MLAQTSFTEATSWNWIDMHDTPVTFEPEYHKHWLLSVFAPQAFKHATAPPEQLMGTWLSSSCLVASVAPRQLEHLQPTRNQLPIPEDC